MKIRIVTISFLTLTLLATTAKSKNDDLSLVLLLKNKAGDLKIAQGHVNNMNDDSYLVHDYLSILPLDWKKANKHIKKALRNQEVYILST